MAEAYGSGENITGSIGAQEPQGLGWKSLEFLQRSKLYKLSSGMKCCHSEGHGVTPDCGNGRPIDDGAGLHGDFLLDQL